MSKRFDNKRLLYVFGALAVILLLTFILKVPNEKATLKGELVEFDTAAVYKIIITPKSSTEESFEFVKENSRWTVRQGKISSKPAGGAIQNIFNQFLSIKPKSLAAVDKSKWEEYELSDTLATSVKFLNVRGKEIAGIQIGKFSYKQAQNPYGYYGGGNNVEGTSYVRVNGEKEIYAVDGFLALSFNGKFSDWRDKSLIRCNKDDVLKITFTFPGDSSFVLEKKEPGWLAGGIKADSASVANYLNSMLYIDGQDIKDGFNPVSNPAYQMVIEGNNLLSISIKCFREEGTGDYFINSSINPEIYFLSKKEGIFSQVFRSKKHFIKK